MEKRNQNNEWFTSSESSNIKDSMHNSRAAHFIDRTHSLQVFHLIAATFQVFLGLAVITVCLVGFLRPFWLTTGIITIASASTMIGLYLLYITITKLKDHNSLLRTAIRRVLEFRN